jgi:S-adenosylmethionine:tRNA ribosyltransferase-isomerase
MLVDEFDFALPADRIAQRPLANRGDSRLLVLDRATGTHADRRFAELPEVLRPGDLLVRNDTRVMRARLRGERPSGGAVEVLLLERVSAAGEGEVWSCLARPGRRLRAGEGARLAGGIDAEWLDATDAEGVRHVRLRAPRPILEVLDEHGEIPLPPYIDRPPDGGDLETYQTTYARVPGAVAAPTAGLHFTPELDRALRTRGVEIVTLTLHVGAGTFLPVRTPVVEEHRLLPERVEISEATAAAIASAKAGGRRVVAVGTTTVRALEGRSGETGVAAGAGDVSLFITPGFRFRTVDALVTNFHLPRSTLLMLVAAFAGRERILAAYRHAVEAGYRFFSYGDAMWIA